MNVINVDGTDETPAVVLDAENGKYEFSGRSMPEDVTQFYNPILEWFEGYAENPKPSMDVVFKMDYFNTASSKMILDILLKLDEINEGDTVVKIKWCYKEDDEDMEEAGEEYADLVEIEFDLEGY